MVDDDNKDSSRDWLSRVDVANGNLWLPFADLQEGPRKAEGVELSRK